MTEANPSGFSPVKDPGRQTFIGARLERLPVGRWHHKLALVVGLGVFYELFEVFMGGVLAAVLTPIWGLSTVEKSVLIGSVFLGMFVGTNVLGRLGDRYGRRRMFFVNLGIYLAFTILAAFSPNVWILAACRFLAGTGAGAEAALIDAYISEFVPKWVRGRYVSLTLVFGMLAYPLVALLGAPLARTTFLWDGWRWLLLAGGSGVLLILWMRRRLPESPRWLVSQGRYEEAEQVLSGIENEIARNEKVELPAYESIPDAPGRRDTVSLKTLWEPAHRIRVFVISALCVFGTLGYYGFSSLAPIILLSKGFDIVQSLTFTAVIGIGYPLGALASFLLSDRAERKHLLVYSGIIQAALGLVFGFVTQSWAILAVGFVLTLFANLFFALAHIYQAEVFPTSIRTTAIGFGYGLGRLAAAILPFVGLAILDAFGAVGLLSGSALMFTLCVIVVGLLGPRTTGKTLEEAA
ncbi:MFS transporter [Rhodococcoides yunnanense]|uniref:MFS transporter n=1 Tax=Rhodococcoides yunnanense TaxID=278209 RepID=UPI00093520AC|nr:MFS transporter [Rhodococcus yunnanensis]